MTSPASSLAPPAVATAVVPKYVRKCPHRTEWQRAVPYQLLYWPPGQPREAKHVTAHCGSWRCSGACRRRAGSILWRRIVDALEGHDERDVLFAVLTLDQRGTYSGDAWADSTQAYRELGRLANAWMHRLNRFLEAAGLDPVGSRWVAVVEQHRTGWPHCNIILVSRGLADIVRADSRAWKAKHGEPVTRAQKRAHALVKGELQRHTVGAGWGPYSTIEVAESRAAVAGYIVKVAGTLDDPGSDATRAEHRERMGATSGELAKPSQVPTAAPQGFRRVRSGIRFLAPRHKTRHTGALVDQGAVVKLPRLPRLVACRRIVGRASRLLATMERLDSPRLARARELVELITARFHRDLVRLAELSTALEVTGQPAATQVANLLRLAAGRSPPDEPEPEPDELDDELDEPDEPGPPGRSTLALIRRARGG